jgi:mannose-1-phosphate guanylyltransferase/phosphomannomutase
MDGRFVAAPFADLAAPRISVSPTAQVAPTATVAGPCFIDDEVVVGAGAQVRPYSVIGRGSTVEEGATVEGAILWPNCRVGRDATVRDAIVGRQCDLGHGARVTGGTVLGDRSTVTDYTRI